jgi:hypothetical protein
MSGLFNQASLVLVPSGYKAGKVYSQVPTDGDGDLTFTRASSATRVNSDGLIEKARTNAITYSQDFSNWILGQVNVTTSATANPLDGALNAQDITPTAILAVHRLLLVGGVPNSLNTWSVYAKANGYNFITIVENNNTGARVSFNLSSGVVGTELAGGVGEIESLGNGWYRCSMIHTTLSGTRFDIYVTPTDSIASYTADGTSGVILFGAQAETGSTATEYIPTTNSARTTFAGITQDGTSASNVPRLDYSQGSCPSLLLEPQRTNTILRSQDLSNASWTKTNVTITQNAITSPIESFNSDAIVENSGTNTVFGFHAASRPSGLTIGTTYSVSFFAKKITRDWCYFDDFNAFQTPRVLVFFNLANGTVGTSQIGVLNPKMENYGNGWYRCSFQFVASSTLIDYRIASATSDNTVSYSGTIGQESISVTACQFEAGSYATSYIPTTSATVTRLADACSKTGISSLIGQTEGVLYWEGVVLNQTDIVAINRSTVNGIYITKGSGNLYRAAIYNSSSVIQFADVGVKTTTTKIAIAYKSGDSALFVNGSKIGATNTSTITFSGALSELRLNDNYLISTAPQFTNKINIYNTRLTDTQCIELTTL